MATVELQQVRKSYDKFVAVKDLSLEIEQGSIFGLLGPNGAGKTSTIRMMIGITVPDSGQVRMFGEPFNRHHLRRVGYLPETSGLYKKMKVSEQLVLFGQLRGLSATDAAARAKKWCERMEIAGWMDKKTEELSKGMQQKMQFISTLLHDPEFLIMDEPFSGLDPVNASLLKDVLLDLNKQGRTILFSTHRMDQVERLCSSICLVNRGEAVLQGKLKDIKASYGRSNVQIEYEGGDDFLHEKALVQSFNNYGNYVEVRLAPGADSQKLLQLCVQRSRVNKFELVEPSLESIFIDTVGKNDA
ncbi:MAG TPA: ATP-binding cassette domain-containing protein [Terriglobales bacterium]|jgi:ABC-2 type transport system ATP-binding protein|nr:ATP-binding cassette domain-containing protein [Terriglobales bacterium]